jgi:hypothetical protein
MLSRIREDEIYFDRLCLSNAAIFHVCGTVNKHNFHVWENENHQDITEHERDLQKVNVWCSLMKCYRSFLFLRTYSGWWQFSGYDGNHYSV